MFHLVGIFSEFGMIYNIINPDIIMQPLTARSSTTMGVFASAMGIEILTHVFGIKKICDTFFLCIMIP